MSGVQVRRAADVADLRSHLVRQWQPGGAFHRAAWAAIGQLRDPQRARTYRDEAETERVGLQRSTLWYVEHPMVDLLCNIKEAVPDDVRPLDLAWPSDSGLVVFARPIPGTAIDRPRQYGTAMLATDIRTNPEVANHSHPTEVGAIMWNRSVLPDWPDTGGPKRLPCLSVHSYRWLDYEQGLDGNDIQVAQMLGELTQDELVRHADRLVFSDGTSFPGYTGEALAYARKHRDDDVTVQVSAFLRGGFWAPMGHSDWPAVTTLDHRPPWCKEGVMWESFKEDRQLVAALFTALAEDAISQRTTAPTDRATARRVQRDRERHAITAPSEVVVINLRRPRGVPHDHEVPEAPAGASRYSHRWLVREHPRWQPYGPGRQERRLTIIPAHIKGPEDKPLVIKTKVNRWIR